MRALANVRKRPMVVGGGGKLPAYMIYAAWEEYEDHVVEVIGLNMYCWGSNPLPQGDRP